MFENILGNLNLGGLGGIGTLNKPAAKQTQQPYKVDLIIQDGDAAYNTMALVLAIIGAMAAGAGYTKIWEKTIPAQQALRWGYGSPALPHNQGYMYFISLDTAVNFQIGKLRLVQANARETKAFVVGEYNDNRLHTADITTVITARPVSINDMIALPEKTEFPKVGEDSKLSLHYYCVTPATAEDTVEFSIPASVYQ